MNEAICISRDDEDLTAISISLQALAEQQNLQLEMLTEIAKLLSHLTITQREQRTRLEAMAPQ
ncbi:MAG: hypothetical protein DI528_20900 [Shinella sp.]|nr:MAG: hypothetical protein DI528_20900 [Shinella sp.]